MLQPLRTPFFYDAGHVNDRNYEPNCPRVYEAAQQWRASNQHLTTPDWRRRQVILINVDCQSDFAHPLGALPVTGRSGQAGLVAMINLSEFIYRYLLEIDFIINTQDTHHPFQVFFTDAHVNKDGQPVTPHTTILADDYEHHRFRANPVFAQVVGVDEDLLSEYILEYCLQLEQNTEQYRLYIWPYHCLDSSPGHRLCGIVEEAWRYHSWVRVVPTLLFRKGMMYLSEFYSIFRPEVPSPLPQDMLGDFSFFNERLFNDIVKFDKVLVAGLASTHCVRDTVLDYIQHCYDIDQPELISKLHLLMDCTAPVVVPGGTDFTPQEEALFSYVRQCGGHVVTSHDPLFD